MLDFHGWGAYSGNQEYRGVFNSPFSHLNLRFSVEICRNCWALRKINHFITIYTSVFRFEVIKMGFKWGMTVLLIHFSPNLHFNLQIKMPRSKLRSEMGLLNTLQRGFRWCRRRRQRWGIYSGASRWISWPWTWWLRLLWQLERLEDWWAVGTPLPTSQVRITAWVDSLSSTWVKSWLKSDFLTHLLLNESKNIGFSWVSSSKVKFYLSQV